MKALKLKSSPDDNPVWGRFILRGLTPHKTNDVQFWEDSKTIEDFHVTATNFTTLSEWELVTVELTIKR